MKVIPKLSTTAQTVLCKRYLKKGSNYPVCAHCGETHESVEDMFERVSFGNEDFYNLMASLDFLPNSPTLFNAGNSGTLSGCFKFDVQDDMVSILDVGRKSALVQKWGGGVGYCLSELRPKGAHIRSTHGKACGPIAVMRYYHAIAQMITQGGKREGAQMAVLHCGHGDIAEFIQCKKTEGVLDTFNISVAMTDDFMRKAVEGVMQERVLFEEIVKNAWSNGDPGLYFIDTAERANSTPHLGKLTGTNPCYAYDSLVSTSRGLVRIQDLVRGDEAYVGDGKFETVVKVHDIGNRGTVRIKTKRNYECVVTPEQEMCVKDGDVVLAKNLKLGDVLVLQEDGCFLSGGSRELGRIAGWITGDGGCSSYRTHVSINERDVPIVEEELLPLIEKFFPSRLSSRAKIRTFKQRSGNLGHQYMSGIRSLYDFVLETCTKDKISGEVLLSGKEFIRGFIECLFFADGHAELGNGMRQLALTCKDRRFAQDVRVVLLQFGIKTSLYTVPRTGHESDTYYGFKDTQSSYRIQLGGVDRKKFLEEFDFLKFRPDLAGVFESVETYQSSREYEVVAIEDVDTVSVYDFTTNGKRLVYVDGIRSRECGEVPLLDNESCNLGSINLSHFVRGDAFDWVRLKDVVRLAVRYLDCVLDNNFYPIPEVREATLLTRKLGLGVMGWADALALIRIPYDSQEAVDLGGQLMATIQKTAHDESVELAKEKGVYPGGQVGTSCPEDVATQRRNACLTCIAPTGSISTIADCSSGIEPHYSLKYTQVMGDGTKLQRELDFGDFIPKTAHEINWNWHVKHQAAFQEYTHLAVSKTINMPNSATVEDVKNAYVMAWESGCKGITIYREGSRVKQALEISTSIPDKVFPDGDYNALVHKFKIGDMKGWMHWGLKPADNIPYEVFITASKQGSTVDGLLDAVAILISIALQSGVPLEELVDKMRGRRFEPSGLTSNPKIPTASSILDYLARFAQVKFLGAPSDYNSGTFCPNCGAHAINQGGCLVCSESCGWSKC